MTTEDKNRLKKIEENLEAVTDQVGKLSEDMTGVKRQLKELKDKVENTSNDR